MGSPSAVIVDGLRTPFLKAGTIPNLNATELALVPIRELLHRHPKLVGTIDHVVCANVGNQLLPPDGSNLGRLIGLRAGIGQWVSAETININCGSGLQAVRHAARYVQTGEARCVLVVGIEVMSDYTAVYSRNQRAKFAKLLATARARMPAWKKLPKLAAERAAIGCMPHKPEWLIKLGLTDPYSEMGMDEISDAIAGDWKISREELDLYAQESHRLAFQAREKLKEEMVGCFGLDHDTGVRENQTLGQLSKLKPLHEGGVTTPGNSSQITDGAVALIVASNEVVQQNAWPTLATMKSEWSTAAGCEPSRMGLGPVAAIEKLLHRNDLRLSDFNLIETNEAFASVVIAQSRALSSKEYCAGFGLGRSIGDLAFDITNVNGGAIAKGHPIGATGVGLVLTCAKELKRRDQRYGLVTLCVGGGQGVAAVIENKNS